MDIYSIVRAIFLLAIIAIQVFNISGHSINQFWTLGALIGYVLTALADPNSYIESNDTENEPKKENH